MGESSFCVFVAGFPTLGEVGIEWGVGIFAVSFNYLLQNVVFIDDWLGCGVGFLVHSLDCLPEQFSFVIGAWFRCARDDMLIGDSSSLCFSKKGFGLLDNFGIG